jgi:acetyl-CoA carboxylase biotin carboxyl carrier protein
MRAKIDFKEIMKIIDLLEEKKLSHFELEIEGFKIKINRGQPQAPSEEKNFNPVVTNNQAVNEALSAEEEELQEIQNNLHYITSPMVGTLYRKPDPASQTFVEEGDSVKKNQTLCIIEAMKLMNEIECDVEGTLEKIFVENGKSVEYGQRLFAVKPL